MNVEIQNNCYKNIEITLRLIDLPSANTDWHTMQQKNIKQQGKTKVLSIFFLLRNYSQRQGKSTAHPVIYVHPRTFSIPLKKIMKMNPFSYEHVQFSANAWVYMRETRQKILHRRREPCLAVNYTHDLHI